MKLHIYIEYGSYWVILKAFDHKSIGKLAFLGALVVFTATPGRGTDVLSTVTVLKVRARSIYGS